MTSKATILNNIREYERKARETTPAESSLTPADAEEYVARLNKSLQTLQNQIKEHEAALKRLRGSSSTMGALEAPSDDKRTRVQQTRTIASAYRAIAATAPTLPSPESPLPALLAVRTTLRLIEQSKAQIHETSTSLAKAQSESRREIQSLGDAETLGSILSERIETLKEDEKQISRKDEDEVANELITAQEKKKQRYNQDLRTLVKAFNKFVRDRLAIMLAAEDIGGPNVGDALDLREEDLIAGFTQEGRTRKMPLQSTWRENARRKRMEDIWGIEAYDVDIESLSEKDAAGNEFRNLTEDLLNAAAEAELEAANPYIELDRESAAVRFLVRAKVAEFDPQDSRRLRLLDFGADLDH